MSILNASSKLKPFGLIVEYRLLKSCQLTFMYSCQVLNCNYMTQRTVVGTLIISSPGEICHKLRTTCILHVKVLFQVKVVSYDILDTSVELSWQQNVRDLLLLGSEFFCFVLTSESTIQS